MLLIGDCVESGPHQRWKYAKMASFRASSSYLKKSRWQQAFLLTSLKLFCFRLKCLVGSKLIASNADEKINWIFFIAGKFHQGAKFTIENLWKTLGQIFGRGKEKLSSEHIQFTFAAISGQLHEEEKITFLRWADNKTRHLAAQRIVLCSSFGNKFSWFWKTNSNADTKPEFSKSRLYRVGVCTQ